MAGIFGSGRQRDVSESEINPEAVERLTMLASMAIDQIPLPEPGEMTEEEAWTISPGPSKARVGSLGSPQVASRAAVAPTGPVQATVDTSALERLISSRLDSVEDSMRKFEMRMEESMAMHAPPPQLMDENGMLLSGDTIIGADGQVVTPGEDKTPGHAHLGASLLELYEAQALAVNPFLRAPEELAQEATETIGPHAIAAILLDHLTGLAAVSFVKKATESGLLSAEEGKSLGAIVSLAAPGEAEKALEDHLPDTILLTFSALVSVWRRSTTPVQRTYVAPAPQAEPEPEKKGPSGPRLTPAAMVE